MNTVRGRISDGGGGGGAGGVNGSSGRGGKDFSRAAMGVASGSPLVRRTGGGEFDDDDCLPSNDATGCCVIPFFLPMVSSSISADVTLFFLMATTSASYPYGRDDVGEGRILEGAVGGDVPGEDIPMVGEDVGREGVDECLIPLRRLFTRKDSGGGGANGESLSS